MNKKLDGIKFTVDDAVEQVSEENSVSVQSVKNSYKKHRKSFIEIFKEHNLPIK